METCHHCGTVLPKTPGARYCPNCGEMSVPASDAVSDPSQAYAAASVGAGNRGGSGLPPSEGRMTWELPSRDDATQAIPAQSAPPEPDPYEHLYRPEGGAARANPNATQVMPPVAADFGAPAGRPGFDQPAYDQPIDYQAGGGDGAYGEPYDGGYADEYPGEPGRGPRVGRGAMIGIGAAAGAVLVIVVSLITLGGHSSTPSAGPSPGSQGSVSTPTGTPDSSAPSSTAATTSQSSSPSSSASSPSQHTPGLLQPGDSGAEVKWLQTRLKQLGLYNGPISGTFDATTEAAVVAFQAKTHPADTSGVVGRSTKTALIAAGSKPTLTPAVPDMPGGPFGGDKHHKGGGSSADVKRLQQALATALNSNLKATGQFDMDTFGAVVQYQSAMHLMADGVVNGPVWADLQQGKITG